MIWGLAVKHNEFFEKVARILGAEPGRSLYAEDIPHELRAEALKKYFAVKGKEKPSSLLKALAAGGLIGAGTGGLFGAAASSRGNRLVPALIGAGIGGALGMGAGGFARWADKKEIEHAANFMKQHQGRKLKKALSRHAAEIYGAHRENRRTAEYLDQVQRHQELLSALRGRDRY